MKPRITINTNTNGQLEIWLNEAGRDLLVKSLQNLTLENDHFHMQPEEYHAFPLQSRVYQKGDRLIEWAKVLLRSDEWDRQHFPHVLGHEDV